MNRRRCLALALLAGLASCGEALAHDGHEHDQLDAPHIARNMRTWTHASGRIQLRGSFVALHGDQVQVRREDGGLVDIRRQALSEPDRDWVDDRVDVIRRVNSENAPLLLALRGDDPPAAGAKKDEPGIAAAFRPFADVVKTRSDRDFFYVESNGMPDHPMMIGITAWQQQVPLPQSYRGDNAWRIPLHPVPAKRPMSAKDHFFRGAIALAVNGVPIFNPIKNDGRTDTYLAGELDEYGGHCGRADDYHYHIAPVHLEPKTGKGKPLGYALDGYPIFGYDEPDGAKARPLDKMNGHEDAALGYHYHATKAYPYLNGGFHGEVVERDGQVDPQPRAEPVRPALPPLRGAVITDFKNTGPVANSLTYEIGGRKHVVHYAVEPGGAVVFRFVDENGKVTPETYRRRPGGPRGGGPPRDEPKAKRQRRRAEDAPPRADAPPPTAGATAGFHLTSPVVEDEGRLPKEFTGDGAGISPPLAWSGVPAGTKSFALIMDHEAPDGIKWYWILHDIPSDVTSLARDVKGVGKTGGNSINRRLGYAPPHSKGPGDKRYTITVYALSAQLRVDMPPERVNREALLAAMKGLVLGKAQLSFVSAREGAGDGPPPRRDQRGPQRKEAGR